MKLLVVDDDDVARQVLAHTLEGLGVEVVQATDGEQAWELLAGGLRPALCCCDVVMPRLDGLGLLRRARRHPVLKDLPFVLVSAAADHGTLDDAVAAGVTGYILKPFLAVQSRAVVEAALRQARSARSEHFLVTRRRLGIGLDVLEQRLNALLAAATTCVGPGQSCDLRSLLAASQELGLWRCAALLQDALAAKPDAVQLLLHEVVRLVEEQLADLGQLVPS